MAGEGRKLALHAARFALRANHAAVSFLHTPQLLKRRAALSAPVFVERHFLTQCTRMRFRARR